MYEYTITDTFLTYTPYYNARYKEQRTMAIVNKSIVHAVSSANCADVKWSWRMAFASRNKIIIHKREQFTSLDSGLVESWDWPSNILGAVYDSDTLDMLVETIETDRHLTIYVTIRVADESKITRIIR